MEEGKLPYETIVFVCTNKRGAGERVSCAAEGRCGAFLRDNLKEEVAARNLKSKIRVSASGCLDLCEEGPGVLIAGPRGKMFFKRVSLEDVPSIMDRIVKGE